MTDREACIIFNMILSVCAKIVTIKLDTIKYLLFANISRKRLRDTDIR